MTRSRPPGEERSLLSALRDRILYEQGSQFQIPFPHVTGHGTEQYEQYVNVMGTEPECNQVPVSVHLQYVQEFVQVGVEL